MHLGAVSRVNLQKGFKMYPFNLDIMPETASAPRSVSEGLTQNLGVQKSVPIGEIYITQILQSN